MHSPEVASVNLILTAGDLLVLDLFSRVLTSTDLIIQECEIDLSSPASHVGEGHVISITQKEVGVLGTDSTVHHGVRVGENFVRVFGQQVSDFITTQYAELDISSIDKYSIVLTTESPNVVTSENEDSYPVVLTDSENYFIDSESLDKYKILVSTEEVI